MPLRVDVDPKMLTWACNRSRHGVEPFVQRIPRLANWLDRSAQPTLKQLEDFAKATRTPIGYLFLPEPPVEAVPIPDMRTVGSAQLEHPSPDLLDTLYICQQRQEWYRDFARSVGVARCPLVSAAKLTDDVVPTGAWLREALGFDLEERRRASSWTEALRQFIAQADEAGVLVMVNGVVGSNNRRKLDPQEFRGFALSDPVAPLVFINGADSKAAQMFTLAHELAHLLLGQSALSDVGPASAPERDVEVWCNRVAAEFLVPMAALRAAYDAAADFDEQVSALARRFKVSSLVILRRIHDAGVLSREAYWQKHLAELERLASLERKSGGNFYLTQAARVSKRFARALVVSTLEGQTLHRDAFRLLGFSKYETFKKLGDSLGVAV